MDTWKFELLVKPSDEETVNEGPVWDGEHLYFSQLRANRIMRYDPKKDEVSQWTGKTNRISGLAHDAHGHLFGCSARGRAVVRLDHNGTITPVATHLDGKKFNTPSDLAIDRQGRIWFTNAWGKGNIGPDDRQELDEAVVRLDPQKDGTFKATQVSFDLTHPNGILISKDQSTLYVAESGYEKEPVRELRAYAIQADGTLGAYRTLITWGGDARGVHRGIDGMCLDAEGNILATAGWEKSGAGPMLYVISPTGRVLETHPIPADHPTNCCFGGRDLTTLYVTTFHAVYQVQTNRVGWAMYP